MLPLCHPSKKNQSYVPEVSILNSLLIIKSHNPEPKPRYQPRIKDAQ